MHDPTILARSPLNDHIRKGCVESIAIILLTLNYPLKLNVPDLFLPQSEFFQIYWMKGYHFIGYILSTLQILIEAFLHHILVPAMFDDVKKGARMIKITSNLKRDDPFYDSGTLLMQQS